MSREDKNQNEKRPTEFKTTEKKDRKLSKRKENIEMLQEIPTGTL
jgi:hypothetical protein